MTTARPTRRRRTRGREPVRTALGRAAVRLPAWSAALAIVVALATSPVSATEAKRVLVLETADLDSIQRVTSSLIDGLGDAGYRPNKTIELRIINAEWNRERGESLLRAAIAEDRPDLVISVATLASQAARAVLRDTDIPQLFVFVAAPVQAGLVESTEGATGTNITGQLHGVPAATKVELAMKTLEKIDIPRPVRIGVLHSDYPSALADVEEMQRSASVRADVTIAPFRAQAPSDADGVEDMTRAVLSRLPAWTDRVDVLWVAEGPMGRSADFVAAIAAASPVPVVMTPDAKTLCGGALLAVAAEPETEGREAAQMARTILDGTPAGEIPLTRPSEFRVAINLGEAVRRDIVVPPDVLEVADVDACHPDRRVGGRRR